MRRAINELERQVDEEVQRAADRAVMATLPTVDFDHEACVLGGFESDGCAV